LRIGQDATYSVGSELSGVGVYSREILSRTPELWPDACFVWCYRPHRLWAGLASPAPPNCRKTPLLRSWPRRLDVFHALNQRLDAARFRRAVCTFHDLFVLTAEYSTPEFRARFAEQARRAAERSDLIIAVSEFTAGQVERLLGVERARIRVIPHGCGRQHAAPTVERERLILFVGAIQKRKNVTRLVEAFERVAAGWRLVLAGSLGYGGEAVLERIERSPKRANIETPGYVSEPELERLYARASIFAFPSLDEGFGMPVLEAMARGVPVLTSNGSALKEVSGDAALLVDPTDTDSIAEGLIKLTQDEMLRKKLTERGLQHSANFTWRGAAEQTVAAYRELI
jgi:glycosyltransferase involved in cell wall biosynthesis